MSVEDDLKVGDYVKVDESRAYTHALRWGGMKGRVIALDLTNRNVRQPLAEVRHLGTGRIFKVPQRSLEKITL